MDGVRQRRDRVVTALRRLRDQQTKRMLTAPLGDPLGKVAMEMHVALGRAADVIAALEGQELEQFDATVWPEVKQRIRPTRK